MSYFFFCGTGIAAVAFVAVTGRTTISCCSSCTRVLCRAVLLLRRALSKYCFGSPHADRSFRELRSGSNLLYTCAPARATVERFVRPVTATVGENNTPVPLQSFKEFSVLLVLESHYFKPIQRAKRPPVILSAAAMPMELGVASTVTVAPTIVRVVSPPPSLPTAASAFSPMDDE